MSRRETGRNHKPKGGGGGKPFSRDLKSLDAYLEERQLMRKSTAKDGSCLFRAVAEQVFPSQFLHQKVRMQCVDFIRANQEEFQNFVSMPFDDYLSQLSRELWGGELELVVISKLYGRTVIVYMRSEQNSKVCEQQFNSLKTDDPIRLAYSDGNHYDSVYSIEHMRSMAMCQGILYTMLFGSVLKDRIPSQCVKRLDTINEQEISSITKRGGNDLDKPLQLLSTHYSADSLRAMGSGSYHNAALQIYHIERANIEKFDREVASSIQFQIGDRCRFKLPGGSTQEGEICALNSSYECHTVHVFDANEEWEIPSKEISLKHPYTTNGKRNPQHNLQNRSRNRHGNTRNEDTYNRHDNHHHPSKPLPPTSNPEAWPPPTSTTSGRAQSNKSPTTDSKATPPGMAKSTVNKAPVSDRKGGQGDSKAWPQKVPAFSRSKQVPPGAPSQAQPPGSTAPSLSKNPHTHDSTLHNTGPAVNKAPLPSSLGKNPGLGKPPNPQVNACPVKVNGGPGGSLTSEDFSGNSSSEESTGHHEQAKQVVLPTNSPQPPLQSNSERQSQQHLGQTHYEGQPGPFIPAQNGVWPSRPGEVTGQGRVAPPLIAATPTRPSVNGFPDVHQGRESPYLTPQLPRDPSSQPEDDWPTLNPADSRMLSFMTPLNIPIDKDLEAVTAASYHQLPPFTHLSFPRFNSEPTKGHCDIPPAQSAHSHSFPGSIPFPGNPVLQGQPPNFPNNAQANQAYVVHRTPSGSLAGSKTQTRGEFPSSVSSPKVRSPQPAFSSSDDLKIPRKKHKSEPPKQPRIAANLQPPRAKLVTSSTQTTALQKISTSTQVESLSVTTYTQTYEKNYADVAVEATVSTASALVQATSETRNKATQTSLKIVPSMELEPPSLEEESSPADKIQFAIQYAIQCLEVYADREGSDSERVGTMLEDLKEFEENELSMCVERLQSGLVPLNSSQHDFLQSFALQQLSQQSPLTENRFFNRSNSEDDTAPGLDQREMMQSFLHQQELLRQGGPNGSPTSAVPGGGSSAIPQGKEDSSPYSILQPHGFPPRPLPMNNFPLMMQRPPFMMMPFVPLGGFPMPPFPMLPPQMIPPNIMETQSPQSSGTSHLPMDQESGDKEQPTTVVNEPEQDDGTVSSHQETRNDESSSLPLETHLVAPSAFTVPSSAYEQSSTIVSSEVKVQPGVPDEQSAGSSGLSSSVMIPSRKRSDSPPLTPFESKNPYDSVNNPPVADNEPQLPSDSPGDHSSAVQVDESQNFPNRKGRQSNQQQRSSKAMAQQRKPRQPRYPPAQYSDKQTSQEPPVGGGKSGRNEGRSHREPALSKEPTDSTDSKAKRATTWSGPRTGKYSYQKNKGTAGSKSLGRQQRQQPSQAAAGGQQRQQPPQAAAGGQQRQQPPQAAAGGQQRQQPPQAAAGGQQRQQPPQAAAGGQQRQQPPQAAAGGQQRQQPPQAAAGGQQRQQPPQAAAGGQQRQQPPQAAAGGQQRQQPPQAATGGQQRQQPPQAAAGGQQRQQPPQAAAGGTPIHSTQSPANRFYNRRGRQQESSAQVSSGGARGGQDSTRSTLHLEHPEKRTVPYIAFQPRAFHGGFPSPNYPVSSLEGDYAHPQNVSSPQWKFTTTRDDSSKPPFKVNREILNWNTKEDPWPEWHIDNNYKVEGSQTVEDPFSTLPASQCHWDSDVGDLNVSLTTELLTEGGPPYNTYNVMNTHAQCVSETKVSSKVDSECVVGSYQDK